MTPTSLTLRNVSLGNCLDVAYGFPHYQVAGPAWRDRPTDVIYDILAKTGVPVPESQLKLMLQALLKERLGLVFHLETRELPVYALVVARSGPKFQKSQTEGDSSTKSTGMYANRYERFSMALLARMLDPPFTSRHTVDETGLTGVFDFTLDLGPYVLDPGTGKPILLGNGAIDIENAYIQALPAQLGLRLERKTAPLDVMVIEHVEKDPTGN